MLRKFSGASHFPIDLRLETGPLGQSMERCCMWWQASTHPYFNGSVFSLAHSFLRLPAQS
jgi:hypothetical protein